MSLQRLVANQNLYSQNKYSVCRKYVVKGVKYVLPVTRLHLLPASFCPPLSLFLSLSRSLQLFFHLFLLFSPSFAFSIPLSSHSAFVHPPSFPLRSSTATITIGAETHNTVLTAATIMLHADRRIFQGRPGLPSTVHACNM